MSENPYEAPSAEAALGDAEGPFDNLFARTWAHSKGVRLSAFIRSFSFWLAVVLAFVVSMGSDSVAAMMVLPWLIPFVGRVVSASITSLYIGHVTGRSTKTPRLKAILSTFVLFVPLMIGGLPSTLGLMAFGVEVGSLTHTLLTMFSIVPILLVMPYFWLAAGFWTDGADVLDGFRSAKEILRTNLSSALVPTGAVYALGMMSFIIPPLFLVFDVVSKLLFAEVYVRSAEGAYGLTAEGTGRDYRRDSRNL